MHGYSIQFSRFGLLILLWFLVFKVLKTLNKDFLVIKSIQSKSRVRIKKIPRNKQKIATSRRAAASFQSPRRLVITQGLLSGTSLELGEEPILIGRAPQANLVINDDYSSAYHAKLSRTGHQWYIEDLGSTNGTFLDHSRVNGITVIPLRSQIRIGKTVFELQP